VEVDARVESLGKKIAEAQSRQAPYIVVIGDQEVESGLLSVRRRDGGKAPAVPLEEFQAELMGKIRGRKF